MQSLRFKSLHLPSFEKRLNSNTVLRSLNPETICGVGNTTLTPKTRHAVNHVPNRPHSQKKIHYLQIPTSPSHEGRYIEGIGFQKTIPGRSIRPKHYSVRLLQALRSNGVVESENIQVFLSFRGEIRDFTSALQKKLKEEGYSTFIDTEMKRGVNIDEELIKAIRDAELSVVVISPGYASSKSCLDELVEIMCHRRFGHKVLPVFYHLDPEDILNLTGKFGAAFDGLVKSLEDTADDKFRVSRWKEALKEVAGITGLPYKHHPRYESKFIDEIVAEVKQLLGPPPQRASSSVMAVCVLLYMVLTHVFILHQLLKFIPSMSVHLPH